MAAATRIFQRRRRRRERRKARQQRLGLGLGALMLASALLLLLPAGGAWWMYQDALAALPPLPAGGQAAPAAGPSHFYDRSGATPLFSVREVTNDAASWVMLAELPEPLVTATLLMEDPDFLTRPASSPVTTALRLWQNFIGSPAPPEQTLTLRLMRNLYAPTAALTREREIVLAAELERLHSREALLEWHLNTSHYGNAAWGIEAAARLYLGKAAAQLALDEIALLAAIPPAPVLNPLQNEVSARIRQDEVLRDLQAADAISSEEAAAASATVTQLQARNSQAPRLAPDFSAYARSQARAVLDAQGLDGERLLARGGLRILTTLDLALQERADCLLQLHLGQLAAEQQPGPPCADAELLAPALAMAQPPQEAALVLLDLRNGELLAMQGDATSLRFPPGPLLQPFVYFEAFRSGRTAADMLLDIPLELPGAIEGLIYTPVNADGRYRGPLSLREAMSAGLLPPAVQLASELRLETILARARSLGLVSLDENASPGLSLLERGGEVSMLDLAYTYALFATQGEQRGLQREPTATTTRGRDPLAVLHIEDAQGQLLWQAPRVAGADCNAAPDCTPVFAGELGYLVNDVLADQTARARVLGEADVRLLDIERPAAVVSSMTGQRRAAWALGYTPRYLVGVHLGRSDGGSMSAELSGTGPAAQLWRALMLALHEGQAPENWTAPQQIVEAEVCERSGLLPNGICPMRRERFISGVLPQRVDSHWQLFAINARNGRLATVATPPELLSQRIFFVPPPEALAWWQAGALPLPPDLLDAPDQAATGLAQPEPFAWVGGVVEIRGSLDPQDMNYYLLEFGAGLKPLVWQHIGAGSSAPPERGLLGSWDTSGLAGLHSLRLTIVRADGARESGLRQVTVDNETPTLRLEPGDTNIIWPAEREIHLSAEVEDNMAVNRVDFYRNGQLLGSDRVWPWGFDWRIEGTGTDTFRAVAYDEVGNQASDEMTLRVLRNRQQGQG